MHSAKYALAAGVECCEGTLVIVSSSTLFMISMSAGSNWGMAVAPGRQPLLVRNSQDLIPFQGRGQRSSQQFEMVKWGRSDMTGGRLVAAAQGHIMQAFRGRTCS